MPVSERRLETVIADDAIDSIVWLFTRRQETSMRGIPVTTWTLTAQRRPDGDWDATLTAPAPTLLDYTILGTHTRETGFDPAPGSPDLHLEVDVVCVHCGTRRARTHYLLTAPGGSLVIVGGTCMETFFDSLTPGGLPVSGRILADTMLADPLDLITRRVTYLATAPRWDTLHVLAAAIWARKQDTPFDLTAEHLEILSIPGPDGSTGWDRGVEDRLLEAAILQAWALHEDTTDGDFADAGRRAAARPTVTRHSVKVLAALVGRYSRTRRDERAVANGDPAPSTPYATGFYAPVGEKITVEDVIVEQVKLLDSGSTLLGFRAPTGQRLTWFMSASNQMTPPMLGQHAVLAGTVKAHRTFRGVDDTQLTRCKLAIQH